MTKKLPEFEIGVLPPVADTVGPEHLPAVLWDMLLASELLWRVLSETEDFEAAEILALANSEYAQVAYKLANGERVRLRADAESATVAAVQRATIKLTAAGSDLPSEAAELVSRIGDLALANEGGA